MPPGDNWRASATIDPEATASSYVPANDVCAGLYMEHLLRCVRNMDGHLVQSVDMLVAEQFCRIMKHTHRFSLDEKYASEAAEWDPIMWKKEGVGLKVRARTVAVCSIPICMLPACPPSPCCCLSVGSPRL